MPGNCRLWVGAAGGGVWRTDDALAADPSWTYLTGGIAQNSVGALTADPNDSSGNTLYVGTGEANRCSSGCEAGVGIYKTTNGGNTWTKLAGHLREQRDLRLRRRSVLTPSSGAAIGKILVDPTDPNHIYVCVRTRRPRALARDRVWTTETQRFAPGANSVGLYESTDGGNTFTEVWNGNGSTFRREADVGARPARSARRCLRRRSTKVSGAAPRRSTALVYATALPPGVRTAESRRRDRPRDVGADRQERHDADLPDRRHGWTAPAQPSDFWRTDNANQPAAALLASQAAGATEPPPPGIPFPAIYNGWQKLTSSDDGEPLLRHV